MELAEEFTDVEINILTVIETKKKGWGIQEIEGHSLFIYSGIPMENRANAEVGCIISKLQR